MRLLAAGVALAITAAAAQAAAAPKASPSKAAAPASASPVAPASASGAPAPSAPAATAPGAPAAAPSGNGKPGAGATPAETSKRAGAPAAIDPALDAPPTAGAVEGGSGASPLNPEPDELPSPYVDRAPAGLDALLSDIAALRSRVAALTAHLFSSKVRVFVHTESDEARIDAFVITLDDGVVFRSAGTFVADDEKVIYEHAVAPGNHVLGVDVERHDARGKAYRTWQSTRVSIVVPDKKQLDVDVTVEDDSDMAEDFPDDQDGEYDMDVSVRARVAD